MLTPSLVMVGAPHFFSSTTLRPLGPSVTFTASARWFMPRSRPRRASSLNAIILAIRRSPPGRSRAGSTPAPPAYAPSGPVRRPAGRAGQPATTGPVPPEDPGGREPYRPDLGWHSCPASAKPLFSTLRCRVQVGPGIVIVGRPPIRPAAGPAREPPKPAARPGPPPDAACRGTGGGTRPAAGRATRWPAPAGTPAPVRSGPGAGRAAPTATRHARAAGRTARPVRG